MKYPNHMSKNYLSALNGSLLIALPLLTMLHGCSGGSGGSTGPRPTATPTATVTPTTPTNVLVGSSNVFDLTLNQTSDSTYQNTYADAVNGSESAYIGLRDITIQNSLVVNGPEGAQTTSQFKIELRSVSPIQGGNVFTYTSGTLNAGVTSNRRESQTGVPSIYREWRNLTEDNSEIIVRALTANSVTLELKNIILSPSNPVASGSITFNGTVQATITGQN